MNGINVKYSLDSHYFKVGEAYSMRIGTNDFRIGLLVNYSEDSVTFKVLKNGDIIDFTLRVNDLFYDDYWLVKMKPDYENGKFKNK